MQKFTFYLLFFIISVPLHAQLPPVIWQKCLGGSGYDTSVDTKQAQDGTYMVVGMTKSNDGDVTGYHGQYDLWTVKLDPNGNILWNKAIGGTQDEYASSVVFTADGGAVIAGYTKSTDGDMIGNPSTNPQHQMMFALKIDGSGNIVWKKFIGPNSGGSTWGITQVSSGDFLVCGYSFVGNSLTGSFDGIVIKLDSSGNTIWENFYGGSSSDQIQRIIETSDGNYLCGGSTSTGDDNLLSGWGGLDLWLIKLDTDGNRLWQGSYGTNGGADSFRSLIETSDTGILISSYTSGTGGARSQALGGEDVWILKLSNTGILEWEKSYGGNWRDRPMALYQSVDGYIIGGQTNSFNQGDTIGTIGGSDFWIFKIDQTGSFVWETTFGGTGNDILASFYVTSDNGYIMSGETHSNDGDVSGNHSPGILPTQADCWVLKLGEEALSVKDIEKTVRSIYPNPTKDILHLPFSNEDQISIYDISGKLVKQLMGKEQVLNVQNLPKGTYILKVSDGKYTQSYKFIKQ
ncbi:hypothetical protein CMT45_02410 [Elizabethkingia anophelis]|nr:hypothetical protein [Elizabethkingia anophelis]